MTIRQGINLPGIAAVLDLLDRVQSLQRELDTLRFRTYELVPNPQR